MISLTLLILVTIVLAATAAYFSVVGLAALFSFHFWGTIIMGASLEAGKLVTTSYLYKYWGIISLVRKYLMALIVVLLMVLTSIGIFGYLMQGFQEGSSNKEVSVVKLQTNEKEIARVEARLGDIEKQVANLPSNYVAGRIKLEKTYREEASQLKTLLFQLTKEQTQLKVASLEADSHLGPIVYVAKELGVDTSKAATYLVLLIVVIFDPLTVLLTISINHVLHERQNRLLHEGPSRRIDGVGKRRTTRVRRPTRPDDSSDKEASQGIEEEPRKSEEEPVPVVEPEEPTQPVPAPDNRRVIAATNSGQLIYEN